jgi:hypothetical protein
MDQISRILSFPHPVPQSCRSDQHALYVRCAFHIPSCMPACRRHVDVEGFHRWRMGFPSSRSSRWNRLRFYSASVVDKDWLLYTVQPISPLLYVKSWMELDRRVLAARRGRSLYGVCIGAVVALTAKHEQGMCKRIRAVSCFFVYPPASLSISAVLGSQGTPRGAAKIMS